jgi:hypothetical protein
MKAELLFHERIDYDDGSIVEMKLWRVPLPIPPTTHGLKYSLFYGRTGVREVGYDNERGKGIIGISRAAKRVMCSRPSSNCCPISGRTCAL